MSLPAPSGKPTWILRPRGKGGEQKERCGKNDVPQHGTTSRQRGRQHKQATAKAYPRSIPSQSHLINAQKCSGPNACPTGQMVSTLRLDHGGPSCDRHFSRLRQFLFRDRPSPRRPPTRRLKPRRSTSPRRRSPALGRRSRQQDAGRRRTLQRRPGRGRFQARRRHHHAGGRHRLSDRPLAGRRSRPQALVISGHMDVVEAKPADWQRDPFTPIVENGYLFGRGATDMKLSGTIASPRWPSCAARASSRAAPSSSNFPATRRPT